ncbi:MULTISPECIES: polysaccharide pyruvyl transferase family protein [unclassified Ensifer]|uniref:polysaccharide pyruvyl transferase family protein n=1 Tax=unclassified Ensifer TaxID=2633371 RepID=UPI0008132E4A|nr:MULTISPECIES: polysaccharide pyruvyl transferase family protein [unclassified Ensifer]OCP03392.1 succinoglycan biosynthesis protein exov [Ensifer sp. LC14]OCP03724.1 succinoglycan biosynthesis protein exov [Ensifer sp. LC11]OCP03873.1 succinoglycan biosynthesis protein exov [Ensifer sp. LC13]OCP30287.1 succinoglycan biosynthesis protein exov [Ensifer sp. LC499]
MKPYYWESQHGNFGDDLNLWLWDFLLPGFRDVHEDILLVGVGTVLNRALLPDGIRKLVIGSGYGYGTLPDMRNAAEWDLRCVRGPLTAEKVGLPPERGIVDPAVMVADMPEFQNLPKLHKRSFVPHWESAIAGMWPVTCGTVGLNYIDPRGDAKSVIREIAQSEFIVAESMHGAILADAFRVPWVAVTTSDGINSFKWNDWAKTVGVAYQPRHVPVSSRTEAIIKGTRFWGMGFEAQTSPGHPNRRSVDDDVIVATREPRQTFLRSAAKQFLAAPSTLALWQASRATPQLSSDARLAERKERFHDVLAAVRRAYF